MENAWLDAQIEYLADALRSGGHKLRPDYHARAFGTFVFFSHWQIRVGCPQDLCRELMDHVVAAMKHKPE